MRRKKKLQPSNVAADVRFANIANDPKFRRLPKRDRKVRIDDRFQSMFTDPRFVMRYQVDKRGRPVQKTSKEDLQRYYTLSASEEEESDEAGEEDGQGICDQDDVTTSATSLRETDTVTSSDTELCVVGLNSKGKSASLAGHVCGESDASLIAQTLSNSEDDKEIDDGDGDDDEDDDESVINIDLARGEGNISSSGDDSSEEWAFEDEDEEINHNWAELDKDTPMIEEATHRLAICNMDWEKIRALDIFMLLRSFKPVGSSLTSVTIYPSQYGKQRLEQEAKHGPLELAVDVKGDAESKSAKVNSGHSDEDLDVLSDENSADGTDSDDEDSEAAERAREKLRKYELNRLKYYYAIAICDTSTTAEAIYKECDGLEYERSAVRLDLRFVPIDTVFDEDDVKDHATEADVAASYEPRLFITTALQQSSVQLTWDEDSIDRVQLHQRAFDDDQLEGEDLKNYVAGSSSSSDSDNDGKDDKLPKVREKYNSLLSCLVSADENENPFRKPKLPAKPIAASSSSSTNDLYDPVQNDVKLKSVSPKDIGEPVPTDSLSKSVGLTRMQRYLSEKKEKGKRLRAEQRNKRKRLHGEDEREDKLESPSYTVTTESGDSSACGDARAAEDIRDDQFFSDAREDSSVHRAEAMAQSGARKRKKRKPHDPIREAANFAQAETVTAADVAGLSLLLADDNADDLARGKKHFNVRDLLLDKQKRKKKNANERKNANSVQEADMDGTKPSGDDEFRMDLEDPRFGAIFSSPLYNIEPSDPAYKKTAEMERLLEERDTRTYDSSRTAHTEVPVRIDSRGSVESQESIPCLDTDVKSLVRSLKLKTSNTRQMKR